MANQEGSIYKVRIELLNIPYPAWRILLLPGMIPMDLFLHMLIVGMGWQDYHMYLLRVGDIEYQPTESPEYAEDGVEYRDSNKTIVCNELKKGDTAYMEYDFGDSWGHKITIEDVLKTTRYKLPACLDGAGACPPEDCGGEYGIDNIVNLMENPSLDRDEYEDLVGWLGGRFNKDAFSAKKMTQILRGLFVTQN